MKLKTIYDEEIINQYCKDNEGTGETNWGFYASINELREILGQQSFDFRDDFGSDTHICWWVMDEETGRMYEIYTRDYEINNGGATQIDESQEYWHIGTDHATWVSGKCMADKPAKELVDHIKNLILSSYKSKNKKKQHVFVPNPILRKHRVNYGVIGPFAVPIELQEPKSDETYVNRGLYIELNRDNKFYKNFYSKLSKELQEELNIIIGEYMAYMEESRFNMPEHFNHICKFIADLNVRYNYKTIQNKKEKKLRNKKESLKEKL